MRLKYNNYDEVKIPSATNHKIKIPKIEIPIIKLDGDSLDAMTYSYGYIQTLNTSFMPKDYIVNDNAVILFWYDGTKTVVKRSKKDKNDPIKGFLWAYFQKFSGMSKTKANNYLRQVEAKANEEKKSK